MGKFEELRKDFPILLESVNGKPLVYLDNAATTHKPKQVIEAIDNYYEKYNANPHRGAHALSVFATDAYESSRIKVKNFINASKSSEIIFTKNATEALNLIAYSYGMNFINEGDEIVLSIAEHHSNILPWQQVAKAKGAILKYMHIDNEGKLSMEEVKSKISEKTKIVGITHISNALGTINPVDEIISYAHSKGALVVLDGSQSVPHMKVDVKAIDADFMVFSGHKMLAPMGIGVLYGKEHILDKMPPFLFGGDMIEYVWEDRATFAELPYKLEAGTQNVEGAVGLAAAIDYLENIGFDNIKKREEELTSYALEKMKELSFITIYGPQTMKDRSSVISFGIKDIHPHDVATILDSYGVAVRAGHHCAQPLMKYLGVNSTSRASFHFYNTFEEVDIFIEALRNVRRWLGYAS
ncbi:cysteine desulfurase, SufS family protein [Clostridium argentinense CDC 2741]|uniref:cysteine desulfurase n=1 Tax=Clostridium argentinense CDC 2741 TaxID=1418104 RepID=A0A0C1UC29_9CLOT|nr:cysteine desulfurase [Clostridium argentinense]ARC83812.1 cysteine desulfurase [Clostridium argentinense]KIE45100.1 cysteine desulfurase, SufS family protein [Clostridium argentinense CDC 2741]NFF39720.1 cysteine desulfurase [Clostridium argentinense]NFP49720.1 cysteine desulfurase [Clostridium argentinense]NFP72121.1 cysteine desulfurase [Clostridium argentinense]